MSVERALKILQTNFHRLWNGQTARVFLLSQELVRRGHGVVIATPAGSELAKRSREAGLATFEAVRFRKNNRPISFIGDVVAIGRLVRSERFDLLHTHGSQDTWAMLFARRIFSLTQPILMTRHNTKPVQFHRANRWLYGHAIDHLVVVSKAALENYRRFFEAGILDEREVTVIHSCIDLGRFTKLCHPEKIRTELGVDDRTPLIGLVGRISDDKGHLVLLDAIPEIVKEFPQALFLFVGKEGKTMGPILRDLIDKKGLQKSVRLLGFREDIPDITAALDVSVLPSLGTDSSPAVLKEALFLGKPVVASRVGGIPEIVHDAEGILVTPGNAFELARAIITLLQAQCREDRRQTWRGFPEQFTPGFMCAAYLRVYEKVLTGKGVLDVPLAGARG